MNQLINIVFLESHSVKKLESLIILIKISSGLNNAFLSAAWIMLFCQWFSHIYLLIISSLITIIVFISPHAANEQNVQNMEITLFEQWLMNPRLRKIMKKRCKVWMWIQERRKYAKYVVIFLSDLTLEQFLVKVVRHSSGEMQPKWRFFHWTIHIQMCIYSGFNISESPLCIFWQLQHWPGHKEVKKYFR